MRHAGTPPSLPLEQQIRNAERRLAERRRSASAHLATVKRRVHTGLTSPATLLVALGVGVALGQFASMRRDRTPRAPARGAGVLAMLLDALRIAVPIAAMLSTLGAAHTAPQPRTAVPRASREQRDRPDAPRPDARCPQA